MLKLQSILLLALTASLAISVLAGQPSFAQSMTQSYVVQPGDTINGIAQRFYGKSSLGPSLWRANRELVAHPNRLTPGDTIYIFPESTLSLRTPVQVPPPPEAAPTFLYEENQLLQLSFPKFFSFVADPRGQGGTGITRINVKKKDPSTGAEIDALYEVHMVGEIIASSDRGNYLAGDDHSKSRAGRLLLSTGDNVIVLFTNDMAKLRDSDTYEDPDPYFTSYPIYSLEDFVIETERQRPTYRENLGQLFHYKGRLTVVARVEGLSPTSSGATNSAQRGSNNQDLEPVSYVARITYSEDAINLNDKIFFFVPTDPGPERRLDPAFVESPDTYASPGK
ncbi:MAG: LysM peptidoglycan-binding domain-containing protein [Deltaproteobacteria bacterium]|jgi:hypothetical protein|nr:LysM peptidoglycan-binding domain-containing protein [Deltaproteobacteria bacterium]